tara:strand:+ start:325 stop:513 length:189 start_codon:yes stop_codon:yes gene_type:complete
MKPVADAAQPEYEFSIDTTTGMSAPPIDATRCIPKNNEIVNMKPRAIMPSSIDDEPTNIVPK